MGLIDWIRSLFSSDTTEQDGGDVAVTVERTPDATSEKAVKEPVDEGGAESGSPSGEPRTPAAGEDDVETEESDEGQSTASAVEGRDKAATEDTPQASGEVLDDEETGEGLEKEETSVDGEDEETGEGVDEEESREKPEGSDVDDGHADDSKGTVGSSPTELKGIGDAYAERLASAGVDTVESLAAADAADLAEETGISAKRIDRWIDRARDY
ncbi:MAG: helix-hairpin-helix domain-containing protein [Halanaeroarchaeum sp.]